MSGRDAQEYVDDMGQPTYPDEGYAPDPQFKVKMDAKPAYRPGLRTLSEARRSEVFIPGEVLINDTPKSTSLPKTLLPTESGTRKGFPVATGFLDYFPAAAVAISELSRIGNDQHNPGEPLHWARGKSMDESDTMMRHFLERGLLDRDGVKHSTKMAWRALAILQKELEAEGYPIARGAR